MELLPQSHESNACVPSSYECDSRLWGIAYVQHNVDLHLMDQTQSADSFEFFQSARTFCLLKGTVNVRFSIDFDLGIPVYLALILCQRANAACHQFICIWDASNNRSQFNDCMTWCAVDLLLGCINLLLYYRRDVWRAKSNTNANKKAGCPLRYPVLSCVSTLRSTPQLTTFAFTLFPWPCHYLFVFYHFRQ